MHISKLPAFSLLVKLVLLNQSNHQIDTNLMKVKRKHFLLRKPSFPCLFPPLCIRSGSANFSEASRANRQGWTKIKNTSES